MDKIRHKVSPVWITVPVFIIICVVFSLYFRKTKACNVVIFGDSRIVGAGLTRTIPDMIADGTGLSVCNAAFGGTTLSMTGSDGYTEVSTDFSMVSLSGLAAFGDFGVLETITDTRGLGFVNLPEYKTSIRGLKATDLTKVDHIVIAHGVNDATMGIPARNDKDPKDCRCFEGALREVITNLGTAAPSSKIILVSPVFFSLEGLESNRELLREYRDCEAEIAKEYGLIFVDAYNEAGIGKEHLTDGLHFNDEGARLVADLIIKAIKDNE